LQFFKLFKTASRGPSATDLSRFTSVLAARLGVRLNFSSRNLQFPTHLTFPTFNSSTLNLL